MTVDPTQNEQASQAPEFTLSLPTPRRCVPPQSAAIYLGFKSVRAMDQHRNPPVFIRLGKRTRVYAIEDLDNWLEQHPRVTPCGGVVNEALR